MHRSLSPALAPHGVHPRHGEAALAPHGPLIGHYAHPLDPSERTALCGEQILGVPAFGEFQACLPCQVNREAQDLAPLTGGKLDGVGDLLREFFDAG